MGHNAVKGLGNTRPLGGLQSDPITGGIAEIKYVRLGGDEPVDVVRARVAQKQVALFAHSWITGWQSGLRAGLGQVVGVV